MPRLLLLRHAKSSWEVTATGFAASSTVSDIDRPLSRRGRTAAARMGEEIHTLGLIPDRVLCSPAVRARQTLEYVSQTCPGIGVTITERELYYGAGTDYIDIIRAGGGAARQLMVIGHNPVIHATAARLAARSNHRDAGKLVARYPTAALAVFDVAGVWTDLTPQAANLTAFLLPRELDA